MHNRIMHSLTFNRWHEKQLISSFTWLVSCMLCGFLFATVAEYIIRYASGIYAYAGLIGLYFIGIGAVELFRQFWMRFSLAQYCASAATCGNCDTYGRFEVRIDAWPIYACCQKCDYRWVIGQDGAPGK